MNGGGKGIEFYNVSSVKIEHVHAVHCSIDWFTQYNVLIYWQVKSENKILKRIKLLSSVKMLPLERTFQIPYRNIFSSCLAEIREMDFVKMRFLN